ncbi:MAG: hypothetical protein MK171_12780 [Pirellulales bacterium]|nr:hypothetical protein [Pirellulales bacterium]
MSDLMQRYALLFSVISVLASPLRASPPQANISNGVIKARFYLPDPQQGYYRGTRFDWSGVIYSLTCGGHEYFGEWQDSDNPNLHDRITGPVNGFGADPDSGDGFLRIGVGYCVKRSEGTKHPYQIADHGRWTVSHGANWIKFIHEINVSKTQQGYRYVKRVSLTPGRPEMVIDHVLTNTGRTAIQTDVYNHNFFVIDQQPTGPDFSVQFPFKLVADRPLKGLGKLDNNVLTYTKEIPESEFILAFLSGFGDSENDHRFSVENRKTKAGVRMVSDRPMSKLLFWSPRTTLCPEPFIDLNVKPNYSDRWSIRYTFYTLNESSSDARGP